MYMTSMRSVFMWVWFCVLLLSAGLHLHGQDSEPLAPVDFEIIGCNDSGPFYLYQDIAEVNSELESNFEETTVRETTGHGAFVHREYGTILFGYSTLDREVLLIRVHGRGFTTSRGIRIGDSVERVLERYGSEMVFPGVIQYSAPIPGDHLGGEYLLTFRFSEEQLVSRITINRGN
jgi:hypothetical protein